MAFPQEILDLDVELLLDGTWTDITSDVRGADTIRITRGRSSEASEVPPATCSLTLDNRDGKYSPRNPLSPYFGLIGRNTPIRVSAHAGDSYLSINDSSGDRMSTPDAAALDITGDLDVRVEVRLEAPFTDDTTCLLGKYNTTGNQRSWRLLLDGNLLHFTWSTTGADFIEKASTSELPVPPSRRIAVRATLDVNNGAAGSTVTFYTAETIAGPWTQLGDPVVTAGVTSVFASTAPLDIGQIQNLAFLAPVGEILAAEVRNGIGGTLVANPDFTAQTPGATSFVDSSGLTWTLAGDATLSNKRVRFFGEVAFWPAKWVTGGFDVTVPIEASGITRRAGQGVSPLQSTLRRRIPSADPVAYWPMEDGASTISPGSPIDGVAPLTVSDFSFASDDSLGGSDALPTFGDAARLYSKVPGAAAGGWHAEMVYNLETMPATERTMLRLYVSGAGSGVVAVRARCSTAGIRVQALDEDEAVVAQVLYSDADAIADFTGLWNRLQIFSYDDGPNCHVVAAWRDILDNTFWYASTSFSGAPGKVTAVRGSWGTDFNGMGIGHLSVFDTGGTSVTAPGVTIYAGADDGFAGESAIDRLGRLAVEELGVLPLDAFDGDLTSASELLGPQRPDSLLSQYRTAAEVDGGILYEQRDGATQRLVYRDRAGLYNQTPKLTLAYDGADGLVAPLDPVDDDQATRNDITVTRESGSSGRFVLEEGALSVLDPPDGVGRYDDAVTLNLHTDEQAEQHAGWRVHLGTVDEARFPVVKVLLAGAPHMITDASSVDLGDRIQITNPPAWLPPDTIDLLVQGYTETLSQYQWDLDFTCTPASPWEVGVRDDPYRSHRDTAGSVLAGAVADTATALPVTTTLGPRWVDGSVTYSGATATGAGTSADAGYLVCTDADAADITVGDDVRLFGSDGLLKESTVFEITGKPSAFGFTNCEFTPDADAVTESGDQIRVATVTGDAENFPFDIRCGGERMTVTGVVNNDPVTDTFDRTTASSWGSADTGQVWTSTGGSAADFSVSSGAGKHSVGTLNVNRYSVTPAASADFDLQVSASTPVLATGNSQQAYLLGRYLDANNYYGARVDFTTAAAVTVTIIKVVAGAPSAFSTVVTGLAHVANTLYRIRFQGVGTALKAKAWEASGTEPTAWQTEVTDAALTAAGSVGVRTRFLSGNTNTLPVVVSFDDFASPQVMTVTRSVNGITKAHTAATPVSLFRPTVRAL